MRPLPKSTEQSLAARLFRSRAPRAAVAAGYERVAVAATVIKDAGDDGLYAFRGLQRGPVHGSNPVSPADGADLGPCHSQIVAACPG